MRTAEILGPVALILASLIPAREEPATPVRTLWLVGDSTVKNGADSGTGQLWGWGRFLGEWINPARFRVENRALGGRSSRTYRTEGLWDRVLAKVEPGDVILIQFGHNDGGPIDSGRARASLKGIGDESKEVRQADKPVEIVHTFGWYLRQNVIEARQRGAIPVLLSPVPRNIWTPEGKVVRADHDYGAWAEAVARSENVAFLDLNRRVADQYDVEGKERVARDYFTATDHTHTTEAGARVNARCVADGLSSLLDTTLSTAVIAPDNRHK